MPLKRLRKAGDAEAQKPAVQFLEEAQDIVASERAPKQRKASR